MQWEAYPSGRSHPIAILRVRFALGLERAVKPTLVRPEALSWLNATYFMEVPELALEEFCNACNCIELQSEFYRVSWKQRRCYIEHFGNLIQTLCKVGEGWVTLVDGTEILGEPFCGYLAQRYSTKVGSLNVFYISYELIGLVEPPKEFVQETEEEPSLIVRADILLVDEARPVIVQKY